MEKADMKWADTTNVDRAAGTDGGLRAHSFRRSLSLLSGLTLIATLMLLELVWGATEAKAQVVPVTHTRHVDVWYGALSYSDSSAAADEFSPTDHITGTVAGGIFADTNINLSGRPGMVASAAQWVSATNAPTDIDWELAASENLPAEQNLRNALSQDCAQGSLSFAAPIDRGTATYTIATWVTGIDPQIYHTGNAEVSYFELNATCTAAGVRQDAYLAAGTVTSLPGTGAPVMILFLSLSALWAGALLARNRRRKAPR